MAIAVQFGLSGNPPKPTNLGMAEKHALERAASKNRKLRVGRREEEKT